MTIAALFARKVHNTLDVSALEGGKKPAEALIVESARTLLASKDDAPRQIHEVEGGFVVSGTKSAILFADTGDVEAKAIPATTVVENKGEKFDLKHDGKLVLTGTEPELLSYIHKKHSFSMSHALAYEGYSVHKASKEKAPVKEAEGIPVKDLPGGHILAIKGMVQAAHDSIGAAMNEGLLTEAQLDEYMQVAPLVPYEKSLKADDARVSIGGCSIYLSNDDFLAKVPHYGVAEYVMGLALKQAIEDGALDNFVKAVRKNLAGSAKVAALDVELVESTLKESEEAPGKQAITESIKNETESDTPANVMIVVGEEAVELRAENEEGALIASAAYNAKDKKSLDAAMEEIETTAKELGYEVQEAIPVDVSALVVEAVLADVSLMASAEYKAIAEALDRGDAEAAEAALVAATDARLKPLAEGFSSRKHVKGRKPSGLTLPRKALHIKPPKDVGPGSNESVTEGVEAGWLDTVRTMSVPEFAAHILEAVSADAVEVFQKRIDVLAEGYAGGVGQKDLARKITAVNPIIKKRLGKGLDMESIAKPSSVVETVMVAIPANILDPVLEAARKGGALQESEVRISGETIQVRLSKPLAVKLTAEFPLVKLA